MIEPDHPALSVARQCALLGLPRASYYHRPPRPEADENLALLRTIDETYLAYPFFGSRQLTRWLRRQGHKINRKRVQRLMRQMGLAAIYRKPNLSRAQAGHRVYPYLLRHLAVTRPNQVWATDITYVPVQGGCLSVRRDRLAQPLCPRVGTLQHPRRKLLRARRPAGPRRTAPRRFLTPTRAASSPRPSSPSRSSRSA